MVLLLSEFFNIKRTKIGKYVEIDFEEDFEESLKEFSEGGQKELTKLERIQMLLRLARDKPLL